MIPEREREALMRLTMCARIECDICKYLDSSIDECNERITKNMNILADALIADRKTENSSETQTETQNSNLTFEKRTMRDCYNCKRYETEGECIECHYEPKDEPTISKKEQVDDEPQSNADQRIQGVESVEPMQTERSE